MDPKNRPPNPTGLEVKNNILISVPYVPGISQDFRRIFHYTNAQVILKVTNTLKYIFMYTKAKSLYMLNKIKSANGPVLKKLAVISYAGESS